MNTKLLKYLLNLETYKEKYKNYYKDFLNHLLDKNKHNNFLYHKEFAEFYTNMDLAKVMIQEYCNSTDKDILYQIYHEKNKKYFYVCIGKLPMLNRYNNIYGKYYIVLKYQTNMANTKFTYMKYNCYRTLEEFINKYTLV